MGPGLGVLRDYACVVMRSGSVTAGGRSCRARSRACFHGRAGVWRFGAVVALAFLCAGTSGAHGVWGLSAVDRSPGASMPAESAPRVARAEDMARVLREAIVRTADGRMPAPRTGEPDPRNHLLRALRRLRDPALEPLFSNLSERSDPLLASHGLLGAAECSGAGFNLLMLRRVPHASVRSAVAHRAVEDGLLTPDDLIDLIRWPELDEPTIVFAAGALATGEMASFIPRARLQDLALQGTGDTSLLACVVLSQIGGSTPGGGPGGNGAPAGQAAVPGQAIADRMREHIESIDALPPEALRAVIVRIGAQRLTSGVSVLRAAFDRGGDWGTRAEALRGLLILAPDDEGTQQRFLTAYREALPRAVSGAAPGTAREEDLGARIRLALFAGDAALEGGDAGASRVPESIREALTSDPDVLVADIGRLITACAVGCGSRDDAARALIDHRHAPSASLALRMGASFGEEVLNGLRRRVLAGVERDAAVAYVLLGEQVSRDLLHSSPGGVREVLERAMDEGNAVLVRTVLLGGILGGANGERTIAIVDAIDDERLNAAARLTWQDRDAARALRSVMLGMSAVSAMTPAGGPSVSERRPELSQTLGRIALGEGALPSSVRVQAAWLSLRLSGQDRAALARLLAEGP